MKSLINSKAWAMVVVFMALSLSSAMADEEDFLLSVRNVTQPTGSTIEFDLYLMDTDNTQAFEFAALQMGLLLNSSIHGAGTLTVSYSNTGSGLDPTQQFAGSIDVVAPLAGYDGKTLIRLMANSIPPVPPGAGTGTVIGTAGDGTFLAHFTITSSVSFTPNTRAGLEFCSGTAVSPLWPTVLYAYIEGNSTPLAVTPGVDAIVDGDPVLNATPPSLFNVTGTGDYCEGGAGLPVGLDGSELNTDYTLYRNGVEVTDLAGTGSAITYGNQTAGTYTVFATNDAGTVQMTGQAIITETPDNTITLTSGTGTNIQDVCVNTAITNITYTTTGATDATFDGLPAGVTGSWSAGVVSISGTPTSAGTNNYTVSLIGGCGTASAAGTITVTALPGAAGPITGPSTFTPGTSGVTYSVNPISAATIYIWSYSGTGVTINGSDNSVTLDFEASATPGTLSVFGRNSCGDGAAATLPISSSTRTLTLTSVLLEGLYEGAGTMRQAMGESGPQWPAGIADHITIELHSSTDYSTVVYTISDVALSVTGGAAITIPAVHSGSYFITVKHRNSIETTTSIAVSFSGTSVNYSFASLASAYGGNLGLSGDGRYMIFSGDVNQDGYVDTQDYIGVDNDSYNYAYGYLVTDVDGNGTVDTNDYIFIDNNNYNYVGVIHP